MIRGSIYVQASLLTFSQRCREDDHWACRGPDNAKLMTVVKLWLFGCTESPCLVRVITFVRTQEFSGESLFFCVPHRTQWKWIIVPVPISHIYSLCLSAPCTVLCLVFCIVKSKLIFYFLLIISLYAYRYRACRALNNQLVVFKPSATFTLP